MNSAFSYEFDKAMSMESIGEGLWVITVSDRWSFGSAPNGGYMAALLAKACSLTLGRHPEPMSVTVQYVMPANAGPARIAVKILREGGRLSQVTAELIQNDQVCTQISGVFTNFDKLKGPSHFEGERPELPLLDDCSQVTGANATFRQRVDARWFPSCADYWPSGGSSTMANGGWIKMNDGRDPDPLALLVFADSFPRAVAMRSGRVGWIPTVDMTVQIMQRPAPGYIAACFSSRKLYRGVIEERCELWDSAGDLVAVSRQSAVPRIPAEAADWADDPGDLVMKIPENF